LGRLANLRLGRPRCTGYRAQRAVAALLVSLPLATLTLLLLPQVR